MRQSIKVLESEDGSMQERTMSKKGKIGSRREIMRKKIYANCEGKGEQNKAEWAAGEGKVSNMMEKQNQRQ